MAKSRKKRFHRVRRAGRAVRHHAGKPSLLSIIGIAIPQAAINLGIGGLGYDVSAPGSLTERLKRLTLNEGTMWLGYDFEAHKANTTNAFLNYLGLLLPRVLRMIAGPKRIGKMAIW